MGENGIRYANSSNNLIRKIGRTEENLININTLLFQAAEPRNICSTVLNKDFQGAAHRNMKLYCGALHLENGFYVFSTNIMVRCTFFISVKFFSFTL
jgi:hypothetical protein